jgi:uncharacterized membrane protein (GlpM family)
MTRQFASAALMSRVPGPGYAFAVIGHPVSSARDAERARVTIAQALWSLP